MPEQQQFTNSRFLRLTECPLRQSTIPHAQFSKSTEKTEGHKILSIYSLGGAGGRVILRCVQSLCPFEYLDHRTLLKQKETVTFPDPSLE